MNYLATLIVMRIRFMPFILTILLALLITLVWQFMFIIGVGIKLSVVGVVGC